MNNEQLIKELLNIYATTYENRDLIDDYEEQLKEITELVLQYADGKDEYEFVDDQISSDNILGFYIRKVEDYGF